MTQEEAEKLLNFCVFCEEPAPGVCPTCKEAVKEARKQMIADWLAELQEFQQHE